MINTKSLIYKILSESTEITTLIPSENIFDAYPETVEEFPCIIFLDSNQNDIEFADNLPTSTSISVDIHLFTKALSGFPTTSEIASIVGEVMKSNYFTCTGNNEVSDYDNIRHRVLNFRKEIFQNIN